MVKDFSTSKISVFLDITEYVMKKDERYVLLIKVIIGRGTALSNPPAADQYHKILSVERNKNNHGVLIDVIPAIRKFGVYYRAVILPDGTVIPGNIFYERTYQEIPVDDFSVFDGAVDLLSELDNTAKTLMNYFQTPVSTISKRLKKRTWFYFVLSVRYLRMKILYVQK